MQYLKFSLSPGFLGLLIFTGHSIWATASSAFGAAMEPETPMSEQPPAQETTPPLDTQLEAVAETIVPRERLVWHLADPELVRTELLAALEKARQDKDRTKEVYISRVLDRTGEIRRPEQVHLTLEQVIRIALEHNYAIQVASYNPAVEMTRVVEAEAAFDASFFTNIIKNKVDRPTANELVSADVDLFTSSYGVRKLLPTGMTVSGSYELNRTKNAISFQQINPEYTSNFVFEMRQPLLQGFGIDFNRSIIVLSKNQKNVSDYEFARQVRDTLRLVEEFYWRLVQARRDVLISARLMADYDAIYEYLVARQAFDITPVQIAATKANLEGARFDLVRRLRAVFDAEDRLVSAMNADDLDLADDIEIIPEDLPNLARLIVDRLTEVQAALNHRPEIKEQEIRVASAKIAVGRAKNLEMPRFDLTFRQTYDGLGGTADRSFDEVTRGNFIEYFVGVEFEMPIGNRGPRAAHHRSRLQHAQAVSQLQRVLEEVILDTNLSVRALDSAYDQIAPSYEAAEAREREVESIVARAERKDLNTLNSELGARQSLATARRALLNAMVDYNVAIVDLERAKGTLLQYYNIVIPGSEN